MIPSRLINSRLAAHGHTRQIDAVLKADAASVAVDRAISRVWRELWQALAGVSSPWQAQRIALPILRRLHAVAHSSIADALHKIAVWGRKSAVGNLVKTLPVSWLAAAAIQKVPHDKLRTVRIGSRLGPPYPERGYAPVELPEMQLGYNGIGIPCSPSAFSKPLEDTGRRHLIEDSSFDLPGAIALSIRDGALNIIDNLGRLREPARDELSEEEQRRIFASLLFPPPPEERTRAHIAGLLQNAEFTGRGRWPPETLGAIVADGYAAGKSQREVAKDLMPAVDGVRSSAMRVARTWGIHVAAEEQWQSDQELGDLVIGYQVHASLDWRTRSWHAARSGQIYYLKPKRGQKGMHQCPHPPMEANDPGERPAKAPKLAWNCRCYLNTVLSEPKHITSNPEAMAVFANARDTAIPDPATYDQWFDKADTRSRQLAVGARRYSLVRELLDRVPDWLDFINPNGRLLSMRKLMGESERARNARREQVAKVIAARKDMIEKVATYGFIPPVTA